MQYIEHFLSSEITDHPMLFEVFTTNNDESEAIRMVRNLNVSTKGVLRNMVKDMFGEKGVQIAKRVLKR